MKTKNFAAICALCAGMMFIACQKEDLAIPTQDDATVTFRGAAVNCSTGLTTTYPTTVCAGENFTLSTVGPCGRWKIQETTTGAACNATTGWTDLNGAFTCAGTYSYTTSSPRAPGVYSFRTVHLQNATGGCTNGTCTGFTGEQYCCFTVEVAECGCEESFSYTQTDDNTWEFCYTPDADYTDAQLVFTFAQGIAVSGDIAGWSKNGVTRQNTQDLVVCTQYCWTVGLDCASNPGAHNLWTDFKVNNTSKKNSGTPNIVADCD